MMRIIEFLLNNIFIVVIIIGALASLFGKASKNRPRPIQMPDFGGGDAQGGPIHEQKDQQPKPVRSEPAQSVYRSQSESDRYMLERSLKRAPEPKVHTAQASRALSDRERFLAASVREDDLRKAVVWAEILGPPRAKRPYRK